MVVEEIRSYVWGECIKVEGDVEFVWTEGSSHLGRQPYNLPLALIQQHPVPFPFLSLFCPLCFDSSTATALNILHQFCKSGLCGSLPDVAAVGQRVCVSLEVTQLFTAHHFHFVAHVNFALPAILTLTLLVITGVYTTQTYTLLHKQKGCT